jgi:excisionase family DNA binding protein
LKNWWFCRWPGSCYGESKCCHTPLRNIWRFVRGVTGERLTTHSGSIMVDTKDREKTPTLSLEQVAHICGVSLARVHGWIEKKGLKFVMSRGEVKVAKEDLVAFLMQYNMPIPGGVLPMHSRKVLFIRPDKRGRKAGDDFVRFLSQQICRKTNCYIDSVTFGKSAEYKILTFLPDLILADAVNDNKEALHVIEFAKNIGGMRAVALVRRNLAKEKKDQILAAGASEVLEKNSEWQELADCLNRVFNSLGSDTSQ